VFGIKDAEMVREIMRTGGFRAAALAIGISQSAVSARISALESRLGLSLFDRGQRKVRLTPVGRRFLEQAERLITARDQMVRSLMHSSSYAGAIRIGVAETVVHTWLPNILKILRQEMPEARFELLVDTSKVLATKLEEGEMDVVILMEQASPKNATIHPLGIAAIDWYAAADYEIPDIGTPNMTFAKPLEVSQLVRCPIITFPKDTPPYKQVESVFQDPTLPAPLLHASASLAMIQHLIRDSFGIGTLPVFMAAEDLKSQKLVRLQVAPEAQLDTLNFVLAYMPDWDLPVINTIIKAADTSAEQVNALKSGIMPPY